MWKRRPLRRLFSPSVCSQLSVLRFSTAVLIQAEMGAEDMTPHSGEGDFQGQLTYVTPAGER